MHHRPKIKEAVFSLQCAISFHNYCNCSISTALHLIMKEIHELFISDKNTESVVKTANTGILVSDIRYIPGSFCYNIILL